MRRLTLLLLIVLSLTLITPALALGGYSDKVLTIQPDDLVGYWAGEETGGLFGLDASGNNRHAYYYGPSLSAINAPDGAPVPNYDGINDMLDLPVDTVSGLNAVGAWNWNEGSVSLWVSHDAYVDAYNVIFFVETASGYFNDAIEFLYMVQGESSYISLYMARGGVGASVSTGLPAVGWHHWVWAWNASTLELWLDGVLVDTESFSGTSTEALVAARVRCINLQCSAGRLGIWRAALTGESIEALASWTPLPPSDDNTRFTRIVGSGQLAATDFTITAGDYALYIISAIQAGLLGVLVLLALIRTIRKERRA